MQARRCTQHPDAVIRTSDQLDAHSAVHIIEERRFWEKVYIQGSLDCWEWTAARSGGYGSVFWGGRAQHAQRVAWELTNGPIPEGLHALHSCDNRPCCNPAHLFLGTNADNVRDKVEKGRAQRLHGTANGRAKLTEADVRTIRERYAQGERSPLALGREFGVNPSTISRIVRDEIWSHDALHRIEENRAAEQLNLSNLEAIFASHGWVESAPGVFVKPEDSAYTRWARKHGVPVGVVMADAEVVR